MKLNQDKKKIISKGLRDTTQFTIASSAKAFKILSSGLYADKHMAIIRELSCNAWDGHVAKGNTDVPFVIHLPNALEPYLYIEDYGIGLSHDEALNLYTTYFESTKTDSNDYIGALGLGSKSPFSYTEQFTVESRYGGVRRIYSCYIGEEGFPQISLVHEEPWYKNTGMTITIAVKKEDVPIFLDKCKYIVSWFQSTKPKVIGVQDFKLATFTKVFKGKDWYFYKQDYSNLNYQDRKKIRNDEYTLRVIQGNVAYTINKVILKEAERKFYEKYGSLLTNLIVNFEIGDLDVAASREDLEYTKKTLRALTTKLSSVIEELKTGIDNKIKNYKNKWEAILGLRILKKDYKNIFSYERPLSWRPGGSATHRSSDSISILFEDVKWNGELIDSDSIKIEIPRIVDKNNDQEGHSVLKVFRLTDSAWGSYGGSFYKKNSNILHPDREVITRNRMSSSQPGSKKLNKDEFKIEPKKESILVYFNSSTKGNLSKIRYYLQEYFLQYYTVTKSHYQKFKLDVSIKPEVNFNIEECIVYIFRANENTPDGTLKSITDQLGGCPTILYAGDMPDPPKAAKQSNGRAGFEIYKLGSINHRNNYHWKFSSSDIIQINWDPIDLKTFDYNTNLVYINMNQWRPFDDKTNMKEVIADIRSFAEKAGIYNGDIYGIPKSSKKILDEFGTKDEYFSMLKKRISNIIKQNKSKLNKENSRNEVCNLYDIVFRLRTMLYAKGSLNSDLNKMILNWENDTQKSYEFTLNGEKIDLLQTLNLETRMIGDDDLKDYINNGKYDIESLRKTVQAVKTKFPLYNMIGDSVKRNVLDDRDKSAVISYLELTF
tara:strand:+ start:130 stop:2613 length:2484 start_codon:yes stop_codon:yes gene_type:complete